MIIQRCVVCVELGGQMYDLLPIPNIERRKSFPKIDIKWNSSSKVMEQKHKENRQQQPKKHDLNITQS